jgi:hypothetical protein
MRVVSMLGHFLTDGSSSNDIRQLSVTPLEPRSVKAYIQCIVIVVWMIVAAGVTCLLDAQQFGRRVILGRHLRG